MTSVANMQNLKNRKKPQKHMLILETTSNFKIFWNLIIIVLLGYTAIITPLRTSFFDNADLEKKDIFYGMEMIIDIVFGTDIFINFISAYERIDGVIEYRFKKIALHYLAGFFFIDLTASLPFDLLFVS